MSSSIAIQIVDRTSLITAWFMRILSVNVNKFARLIRLTHLRVRLPDLPLDVQIDGAIDVMGTANIEMGNACRISRDVELGTEDGGRITLGRNVRINRGSTLFSYAEINIGDDTLMGEFVTIRDANHGIKKDINIRQQAHESQAINIGKDVWIGRGCVILPGVTIEDHCVIGANSVVTSSIPKNSIAVGSPARVIKQRQ